MYASVPMLILGITVALAGCQATPQEAAKPVRPVLVQPVIFEPRAPERTFVATIRPRIESDLGFRVPGKVARRLVNVGDAVKAGQALATLDETDLRLQREQAEAEIRAAAAALAQAEAELKRITTLRSEGWSTAAAFDRQKAATEEARGRLTRAERALSLAQNALSYATLVADADGVVTATQIEPGQVVTTGQAAVRLARPGGEGGRDRRPGDRWSRRCATGVGVASRSGQTRTVATRRRLRELSPSADPATRTYLARFCAPEPATSRAARHDGDGHDRRDGGGRVARLPLSALYNQGDGPAVWVVASDGRSSLQPRRRSPPTRPATS